MQWKELSITSGRVPDRLTIESNLEEISDNLNEGIFFKIISLLFSKVSRLWESRLKKHFKAKRAKGRWQLNATSDSTGSFFYKGAAGTTDETWINSDEYKARHKCKFPDLVLKCSNVGEYPC